MYVCYPLRLTTPHEPCNISTCCIASQLTLYDPIRHGMILLMIVLVIIHV